MVKGVVSILRFRPVNAKTWTLWILEYRKAWNVFATKFPNEPPFLGKLSEIHELLLRKEELCCVQLFFCSHCRPEVQTKNIGHVNDIQETSASSWPMLV